MRRFFRWFFARRDPPVPMFTAAGFMAALGRSGLHTGNVGQNPPPRPHELAVWDGQAGVWVTLAPFTGWGSPEARYGKSLWVRALGNSDTDVTWLACDVLPPKAAE